MPYEFSVGDNNFQGEKLNALDQGKMLKRVLPLIPPLIPMFQTLAASEGRELTPQQAISIFSELIGPFSAGLSELKDEDFDWLVLTSVQRLKILAGDKWVAFWSASTKQPLQKELNDISVLLPVTVSVIRENLTPFFLELLTRGLTSKKTPSEEDPQLNGDISPAAKTG